jgi:YidC/Oxa1 family membrane protein insertase
MVSIRDGMEYPLSVTFPDSTVNVLSDVIYETSTDHLDLEKISSAQTVKFSKSYPKEVKIEKIYTFYPEKYTIDLEVRVHNLSDDALKENALLAWNQYIDPSVKMDRYGHTGPIFMYGKEELEKTAVKKITKTETFGPDISWGGFESKYFIASMIPEQPSLTKFVMSKDGNNLVSTCLEGPKNTILPGQLGSFRYTVYIGPKDYDILKAEKIGLENSIDLGSWIKWLSLPLLKCLKFIYGYVHNYGIAIIILTVLIKLIFWPLGNMSYRSMKNMQKLSPQIKQLQEKYKDDKAKLNQEVMGLYKRYKVNPMGGCLPIAIQLPVFFGLYRTLLYSIELRHAPFFFWIQDLSAKDPYYITPIIMGATMFLQQKMSPQPAGNEMQAKLMLWMPVIFTFMFLNFPSGLVVYWLFNNILSIGQQYYINKQTS